MYVINLTTVGQADILPCSSEIYKYDLALSKYDEVLAGLAKVYAESGISLPDDKRPTIPLLKDCLDIDGTKDVITDEVIRGIADRWQQSQYLSNLYLDASISREFELYRARFVSQPPKAARERIEEPILIQSGTTPQDVWPPFLPGVATQQRALRQLPVEGLVPGFRWSFHQSLCLHSMAVASRKIAIALADGDSPKIYEHGLPHYETFSRLMALWAKKSIIVKGERLPLSDSIKLECLEVFDFLYLFLLKKALPLEHLDLWTKANQEDWPYNVNELRYPTKTGRWYSFLSHAGLIIQPHDLCKLIKNCERSDYPVNKHMYMRERGLFDLGAENEWGLFSNFDRFALLDALLPEASHGRVICSQHPLEDPGWWDHVRVAAGSPFRADFNGKYSALKLNHISAGFKPRSAPTAHDFEKSRLSHVKL